MDLWKAHNIGKAIACLVWKHTASQFKYPRRNYYAMRDCYASIFMFGLDWTSF